MSVAGVTMYFKPPKSWPAKRSTGLADDSARAEPTRERNEMRRIPERFIKVG
jgi:hypothetical protein